MENPNDILLSALKKYDIELAKTALEQGADLFLWTDYSLKERSPIYFVLKNALYLGNNGKLAMINLFLHYNKNRKCNPNNTNALVPQQFYEEEVFMWLKYHGLIPIKKEKEFLKKCIQEELVNLVELFLKLSKLEIVDLELIKLSIGKKYIYDGLDLICSGVSLDPSLFSMLTESFKNLKEFKDDLYLEMVRMDRDDLIIFLVDRNLAYEKLDDHFVENSRGPDIELFQKLLERNPDQVSKETALIIAITERDEQRFYLLVSNCKFDKSAIENALIANTGYEDDGITLGICELLGTDGIHRLLK